ncbi:MAG: dihydropteroate synthase [Bacteroidetes bacterium]|nr:MAG: dihydropteroate synthase [Bacteroidota bacterium]
MGILNVTPDSFSDGGRFLDVKDAVFRAAEMIREGASIIDVGGASSRPHGRAYGDGAEPVPVDEESKRVCPVITEIRQQFPDVMISIDTWSAAVAADALKAGANIINDITAMRADPDMPILAGESDTPVILMHSVGLPGEMPHILSYNDVTAEVCRALDHAAGLALAAGCTQIILDPGIGFGKSTADNMRLINQTAQISALGWPVVIGASRKSCIGRILGTGSDPVPVGERLAGSLAVAAYAVGEGAQIIRTHDVRETVDLLTVLASVRTADPESLKPVRV